MNKQKSWKEVVDGNNSKEKYEKHKNVLFENTKKIKNNKLSFYDKQLQKFYNQIVVNDIYEDRRKGRNK